MHSRVELSFISTGVSASAGSEVNRADRLKSEADRVDRVVSILSPGLVNLPLLQLPIPVKSLYMELSDLSENRGGDKKNIYISAAHILKQ